MFLVEDVMALEKVGSFQQEGNAGCFDGIKINLYHLQQLGV
jgi:hypothetical protein